MIKGKTDDQTEPSCTMIILWCPLCREELDGATKIIRNEDECTDETVVTYTLVYECDFCDLIEVQVEIPEARMELVFDPYKKEAIKPRSPICSVCGTDHTDSRARDRCEDIWRASK